VLHPLDQPSPAASINAEAAYGQRRCEGKKNPSYQDQNAVSRRNNAADDMMKNALPMYQAFGDTQVRLLRNADNQAQFLQVIEYTTDRTFELNRQKIASDPIMHNYLQAWRTLFPGAVEADVYEDITEEV